MWLSQRQSPRTSRPSCSQIRGPRSLCCFKQLRLGAILPTAVPVCSGHRPKVPHGQAAFSSPPGLEAARPRPRRGRSWLLWGLSPGRADGRLFLAWSSPCVSVLSSSPCEDTSQMGLGHTLLTSVYLNRLLKEEVEGPGGHSEVLRLWLQHGIWGGTQLTPQQRPWVRGRTAHFCPYSGLGALEAIFPGSLPHPGWDREGGAPPRAPTAGT